MCIQLFLQYNDFNSFRYVLTSSILTSNCSSIFHFLRSLHTEFHDGYTYLQFLEGIQHPIFLSLASFSVFTIFVFLTTAIFTGKRWNLSIVVNCCIFPEDKDTEHFFTNLLAIDTSSFEKCLFISFTWLVTGTGFCESKFFEFFIYPEYSLLEERQIFVGKEYFFSFFRLPLHSVSVFPCCAETFPFDVDPCVDSCYYFLYDQSPSQEVYTYDFEGILCFLLSTSNTQGLIPTYLAYTDLIFCIV